MSNLVTPRDMTAMAKKYSIPISVMIEVCYKCNEKCLHCCLSDRTKAGLDLEQYKVIFNQLKNAGTFYLILTGGEPFIRPDFLDIVKEARRRRFSVCIFTNGLLVDEDIAKELKQLFVQEVHISIYSADQDVHDRITGIKGSFQKSFNAIKILLKHGIFVRIKCPLMSLNALNYKKTKKLARDLNIDIQFTTLITAKNNGCCSTHELQMSDDQLAAVLSDEDVIEQSKHPIYFADNLNCIPCDTIFNGGSIDPDGNVYACNQWPVILGNVLTDKFGDIWTQSAKSLELRATRLKDLDECRECSLFQYCTRCPGLALLEDCCQNGCSLAAKRIAGIRQKIGIYPTAKHIFSAEL